MGNRKDLDLNKAVRAIHELPLPSILVATAAAGQAWEYDLLLMI
jgi:hypothetical protein